MKTLTYSIKINKSTDVVFNKIMDKSVYPDWAKAWGEGMNYEGEWKQGANISFFDHSNGGTKVVIEEMRLNECIKMTHVAMVNAQNIEVHVPDETMHKWIGLQEKYYFKRKNESETELEIVMVTDETFQKMFDDAWPKALHYFKEVCER